MSTAHSSATRSPFLTGAPKRSTTSSWCFRTGTDGGSSLTRRSTTRSMANSSMTARATAAATATATTLPRKAWLASTPSHCRCPIWDRRWRRRAVLRTRVPGVLVSNTVADNLAMTGTLYAPLSRLELCRPRSKQHVVPEGVIAGSLRADISPSTQQSESPFQVPNTGSERVVLFTASVSEGPGFPERPRLVARVRFRDFAKTADGKTVSRPGVTAIVEEWSVLR